MKKAGRGPQDSVSGPGGNADQANDDASSLRKKGLPVRGLESVAMGLYVFLEKQSRRKIGPMRNRANKSMR